MEAVRWGQRHTPFWPTPDELAAPRLKDDIAWPDGPGYAELLFEILPLLRCYFLLGFRCSDFLVLDYTEVPENQSPPEGRRGFSLSTGNSYFIDGVTQSDLDLLGLPQLSGIHRSCTARL